jgi:hypothetical protein
MKLSDACKKELEAAGERFSCRGAEVVDEAVDFDLKVQPKTPKTASSLCRNQRSRVVTKPSFRAGRAWRQQGSSAS